MKKALAVFLVISLVMTMQVLQIFAEDTLIVDSAALYKSKSLYEATEDAILRLHSRFPGITSVENIGESVQGRDIKAMKIGKGDKKIFINGAHHGKEWVTTILILEQMEHILREYERNGTIRGYNVKELLEEGSIYFVPLVNPDGVEIARGTAANPYNVGRNEYKANARGVDLNRNYPAKWEHINRVKNQAPRIIKAMPRSLSQKPKQ